jgi:predicted acylesterase/phospholipase RssA
VATLERGAVVGELAVLAQSERAASIRALRDCDLLKITSEDFTSLMDDSPQLGAAVARTLSAQIQSGVSAPAARRAVPATICLIPADPRVPTTELAHALAAAFGTFADAHILAAPPESATDAGDALARFGPLVDNCEERHDHVVLHGSPLDRADAWTEFSLARADRILLVTSGGPCPEQLADHASLHGCDLVGIDIAPGSGELSSWVERLDPRAIHHVRTGDELSATCGVLARRLAGRSLGVVLSGGGARAFAHIGVLEELLAAGLEVDRVGGVSMGAFVGAQLAAGRTIDEIDATCFDEWVRRNPINDYTLPRKALIRGQKGVARVERVFGELALEELPRSFYCASTDVRRSELVIHRHGSLAAAVIASISLPILAPPRVHDGRLLLDGSLLDNLPVAPMAESGEGPVIAVDIKPRAQSGGSRHGAAPATPTPARVRTSAPPLGETIARVLQLAATDTASAAARHADFVIRAGVDGVGLLEFHQIDAAREAGRRAAREALEQWIR